MPSTAAAMLDVPDDVIALYGRAIIALLVEVSLSVAHINSTIEDINPEA